MPLQAKRWEVHPRLPEALCSRFPHLSPLVLQILYNRGIQEAEDIDVFLGEESPISNPFRLAGMHDAVARVRQAIRGAEAIAVYGDFDADGVTATALLMQTLEALGAHALPYIPHRVDEGYGLNNESLEGLAAQGVKLVVTVDCGIRAIAEVAHARSLKLDVIVTDHHSVGPQLPPAVAVIDPNRPDCPYPFKGLAGVGVAYKLAQALLRAHAQVQSGHAADSALHEEDLLDLVALGTVADVAPLLGENRVLVQRGLARLNPEREDSAAVEDLSGAPGKWDYPSRPGLRALMRTARLKAGAVTAGTIGFILGPRLNAAGRLDSAMLSYELLRATDEREGEVLAQQLHALNRQRRDLTQEALKQARAQIDEREEGDALLHFVSREDILPGIAGLVAGRLCEERYRPAVIVEQGEEFSRGSARSIPDFNITAALDRCAHLLYRYGGHAAAAGFTVQTGTLTELEAALKGIAEEELADAELKPTLSIDAEVGLHELSWATYALLQQFEPCGEQNPTPVLLSHDVSVRDMRPVGGDGQHLKMTLSDGQRHWDAIAFRQGAWAAHRPERVDVAYCLEINEWNGRKNLQLNVQDLRTAAQ